MEKINDLFDQEITKVIDSYPSIYTKDDVVNLLSALRTETLTEALEASRQLAETERKFFISEMDFQEFSSEVTKKLERALNDGTIDPVDLDSAEFTIGYRNTIEIECVNVDADAITDELSNILLDQFQESFGKFITSETE
jgi:hypothetical protein